MTDFADDPIDLSRREDRFAVFVGLLLYLDDPQPDPGIFCLCRLDPESPACRRKRMQGRTLRRQMEPCGSQPLLNHDRGHRAHTVTYSKAASGGGGDDGGGGGGGAGPAPHLARGVGRRFLREARP